MKYTRLLKAKTDKDTIKNTIDYIIKDVQDNFGSNRYEISYYNDPSWLAFKLTDEDSFNESQEGVNTLMDLEKFLENRPYSHQLNIKNNMEKGFGWGNNVFIELKTDENKK